ncbi:poly-gamma-glutamate synthase subunit PgsB/CapB [Geomicrobium sp. JCM 19037]|nr:poly-gamma-glutamate synthase subunit PgsB/CapB [Geomicrobium sp. JCM 19037]
MPIDLDDSTPSYLVNGFAANDAASTINIWDRVKSLGYPTDDAVIIMNCRSDRYERTEQFASDVLPYLPCRTLVTIGETTNPIAAAFDRGEIPADQFLNLESYDTADIIEEVRLI